MRDSQITRQILLEGQVIPAHPLALTSERTIDIRHQRALTRYYCAAGAGGLAVGVHTTQFAIHEPATNMYARVLELAMDVVREQKSNAGEQPLMIAGIVGETKQALQEAETAVQHGYDCGLLSLSALQDASDASLIRHAQAVADVIPLVGFYLQPAVGGRLLSYDFWRRFADIDQVVAIKIAPFNRYHTLDVIRAVTDAGRTDEIALYTGNDDNIILDLLTPFPGGGGFMAGGLLGQWAVWTKRAVELLEDIKTIRTQDAQVPMRMLQLHAELSEANQAIFDPQHNFAGCLSGIHEVLRRQGLMPGTWCLDDAEQLSPGQAAAIDRIYKAYPHLTDDAFVAAHLQEWLDS
ncbi:MAG: dihydrodipicolinate synthase family protein [Candidatus Marinimicrobia bacterium]|nr:dihydrodipicolinate synthase family protein [Candidatus Neomarinimicrobiota bacterium]